MAEVLAEARDNVAFGTPDEWAGLAEPDGVAPAPLDLWRDDLAAFATDDKVALAKELERLTLGHDPRVRVEDANYADVLGESAVATSTGIPASGRATGCYVPCPRWPTMATRPRPASASPSAARRGELDLDKAARDGADRATRLLGATKPASKRITVVLDPFVTAQFLGAVGHPQRRVGAEGSVAVRQPRRRAGGGAAVHPRRRRHQPAGLHRHAARRRGPRHPAHHAHRRRCAPGLRADSYSGRRSGTASTGNAARGVQEHAGVRLPGPVAGARHPAAGRARRRHRRRCAHPDGRRASTPV